MSVLAPTRPPLPDAPPPAEQHIVLDAVTWDQYEAIGEIFENRTSLRLTFDRGRLEIMTVSYLHERYKQLLGRLLEEIAELMNVRIAPGGSMTFRRRELERGLEPDQCFWIANEEWMRTKDTWDPAVDPPPDLVAEIEISRNVLDRLAIYAAMGVPEVWRFNGETVRVLRLQPDGQYHESAASPTFPSVPLQGLVRFLQPNESLDYLSVIRSFRVWLQEHLAK
jgi:Uma2 family endonuclease